MELHALTGDSASGVAPQALTEMLGDSRALQRWKRAPRLKILASVMRYRPGGTVEYVATPQQLSEADLAELASDLTDALRALTADTFEHFESINKVAAPPGTVVTVSEPGFIIVGRFDGVREAANTLGLGGRKARKDGTITAGAIILDSEFDRTSDKRRLLRTHELGHALGYNHVRSRASIMNPHIGSEMNDFDREAALIAFRGPAVVASR